MEEFDCKKIVEDEIDPLISKIYDICLKHKIPMVFSCCASHRESEGVLTSSSQVLDLKNRRMIPFFAAAAVLSNEANVAIVRNENAPEIH